MSEAAAAAASAAVQQLFEAFERVFIIPQSSLYCQQCNKTRMEHNSVGCQVLGKSFRFRFYVNVTTLDKSDWHKIDLVFTSFPFSLHIFNAQ